MYLLIYCWKKPHKMALCWQKNVCKKWSVYLIYIFTCGINAHRTIIYISWWTQVVDWSCSTMWACSFRVCESQVCELTAESFASCVLQLDVFVNFSLRFNQCERCLSYQSAYFVSSPKMRQSESNWVNIIYFNI